MENLNYKDLFIQLFSSLWKIILLTAIHIRDGIVLVSKFMVGLVRKFPQVALVIFIVITVILSVLNFMNVRFSRSTLAHNQFLYEQKLNYLDSVNKMDLESIKNLRDSVYGLKVQLDYYMTVKRSTYTKPVVKTDSIN